MPLAFYQFTTSGCEKPAANDKVGARNNLDLGCFVFGGDEEEIGSMVEMLDLVVFRIR